MIWPAHPRQMSSRSRKASRPANEKVGRGEARRLRLHPRYHRDPAEEPMSAMAAASGSRRRPARTPRSTLMRRRLHDTPKRPGIESSIPSSTTSFPGFSSGASMLSCRARTRHRGAQQIYRLHLARRRTLAGGWQRRGRGGYQRPERRRTTRRSVSAASREPNDAPDDDGAIFTNTRQHDEVGGHEQDIFKSSFDRSAPRLALSCLG